MALKFDPNKNEGCKDLQEIINHSRFLSDKQKEYNDTFGFASSNIDAFTIDFIKSPLYESMGKIIDDISEFIPEDCAKFYRDKFLNYKSECFIILYGRDKSCKDNNYVALLLFNDPRDDGHKEFSWSRKFSIRYFKFEW